MVPIQKARDKGLAVLVIRHDRKVGGAVGASGRGSNAMSGAVDIVLNTRGRKEAIPPLIEKLKPFLALTKPPGELTISLAEGEYQVGGESDAVAFPLAMKLVLESLDDEPACKLTMKQLQEATGLPRTTLQSALEQLESEGSVLRSGRGKKGDAIHYQEKCCRNSKPLGWTLRAESEAA